MLKVVIKYLYFRFLYGDFDFVVGIICFFGRIYKIGLLLFLFRLGKLSVEKFFYGIVFFRNRYCLRRLRNFGKYFLFFFCIVLIKLNCSKGFDRYVL